MDQMNLLPQPPTDNLYKFTAISGLLLCLMSIVGPAVLNYRAYISYSETRGRMRLLQAEKDMVFNDFSEDLSSRAVTTEDLNRFRAKSQDLILRSIEIENENERSLRELEVILIVSGIALFAFVGGVWLMFKGFAMWKGKLQDFQDMIIENEAKSRGTPGQIQAIPAISSAPHSASLSRSKKRSPK